MTLNIHSKPLDTTGCAYNGCDSEPDHMWMGIVEHGRQIDIIPALFCEPHSHSHAVDVSEIQYVGEIGDSIGVESVKIGSVTA